MQDNKSVKSKVSFFSVIMTLGIVYGDIGTSPLYVMRAVLGSSEAITPGFVIGAISCVIWTLTLLTTLKYVIIALRADNKGEGGIFSLFALIRKKAPWIFVFAIIGGATELADGVITPSITVVSATEGLLLVNSHVPVIPIALLIILALFSYQKFGTKVVGSSFGPIMLMWFTMLGIVGTMYVVRAPYIFKAFNPYYAIDFLIGHPGGFVLLGAIFLATTGAEALYSDLGHCGKNNIRISWMFVKLTLILNYLGQGSWILLNMDKVTQTTNPFFGMMQDVSFLIPAIILATLAAIIASQALISGAYTLISVAMSLNLWPRLRISYPTNIKGQMYISSVNWALCIACFFVVLFFKESNNMTAAYGLSITITMLMTTILLSYYLLRIVKVHILVVALFMMTFLTIEGSFLIANLHKFMSGGWFTIMIGGFLFSIMFIWQKGRSLKNRFIEFTRIAPFAELLKDVKKDTTIPKYATNLVYITKANHVGDVETKIIYSIINKQPKRADLYWLLHINITDDPNTKEFKVTTIIPDTLIKIDFNLGFRVQPRINLFFKQVVDEMIRNNEIDMISRYPSLQKHHVLADFRFILIDRIQNYDFDFPPFEQFVMDIYTYLKKIGITEVRAFGLDTSNVVIETVPLSSMKNPKFDLKRIRDLS
ncbi:MAG TPA: KUP/HAK/KT family potassium transporter [Bacteroidales bacterium]|jgi:KUP system potassium uptake protein|nr:KUP/HAK/KT family potassium transporter [Bacteroidales bacterium]HPB26423.1 KUP/HAK/KT family potassium transporter [Bacteroidales bacterium]HPI31293.1 KUP/HAK/KT family potassium transporter [Bacteroidales bacterium]HQN17181.1 KUP/HAK/KT family potassium transporter [Bacteroidales bacterium]